MPFTAACSAGTVTLCKQIIFSTVFFLLFLSFWVGRYNKTLNDWPLGKHWVLFPLDPQWSPWLHFGEHWGSQGNKTHCFPWGQSLSAWCLYLPLQKRHVSSEEESMNQLITIQFNWKGDVKPIGSSFIGTSPEFEMALYTVCFLAGDGEEVHVELDDYDVKVKTHHMGKYLGSCFPQCPWI